MWPRGFGQGGAADHRTGCGTWQSRRTDRPAGRWRPEPRPDDRSRSAGRRPPKDQPAVSAMRHPRGTAACPDGRAAVGALQCRPPATPDGWPHRHGVDAGAGGSVGWGGGWLTEAQSDCRAQPCPAPARAARDATRQARGSGRRQAFEACSGELPTGAAGCNKLRQGSRYVSHSFR